MLACVTAEPTVVAKSNIILDVKPWDDETDMAKVEECVRSIEMDGLLWGACKFQMNVGRDKNPDHWILLSAEYTGCANKKQSPRKNSISPEL